MEALERIIEQIQGIRADLREIIGDEKMEYCDLKDLDHRQQQELEEERLSRILEALQLFHECVPAAHEDMVKFLASELGVLDDFNDVIYPGE